MITLLATWIPGPVELIVIIIITFFVLIWLIVKIAIIRWIFRINEQIKLLTEIKDELRKLRLKKYPDKREVEK